MAVAEPVVPADFGREPQYRSTMLIRPIARSRPDPHDITEVGSTCRVCARQRCPTRREPSILKEGF
jgi:predicted transcriptional regulator